MLFNAFFMYYLDLCNMYIVTFHCCTSKVQYCLDLASSELYILESIVILIVSAKNVE